MGIIDKTGGSFDKLQRNNKGVGVLSLIFASKNVAEGTHEEDRKQRIAQNLVNSFSLFRTTGSGSYGNYSKEELGDQEYEKKLKNQFESQYTMGHEMGIWIDSKLNLCSTANLVAEGHMGVSEYISNVFLNLFSYYILNEEPEYKHILKSILLNLSEEKVITKSKLSEIFNYNNEDRNILFNYLKDSVFFDEFDSTTLKASKEWCDDIDELVNRCNLTYENKDIKEVQIYFKNKENYSAYVTQGYSRNEKYMEKYIWNKNEKKLDVISEDDSKYSEQKNKSELLVGDNIIYYGAPGTGKSYSVTKDILKQYPNFENVESKESSYVFRTTLHPEFTYSDFVGQIMPNVSEQGITYQFSPGIFTKALEKAIMNPIKPIYLVLEELSRANVAAVFGDLFQLLDRSEGNSEYAINNSIIAQYVYNSSNEELALEVENKKIIIPNNLYIIGTVNTNDQNVFVMDTAFKRRFDWKYVSTKPINNENNPEINIMDGSNREYLTTWHQFYLSLNTFITKSMGLGEDKQLGQYFIKFTDDNKLNKEKIKNKLLQYLWDDIQGATFGGIKLFSNEISNFSELYDKFENNKKIFSTKFIDSLQEKNEFLFEKGEIQETDNEKNEAVAEHLGNKAMELIEDYDNILYRLGQTNNLSFSKKPMGYLSFKYFSNAFKNQSGFLEISKGTNGSLLQVSFRKEFIEDEIPNSKSGRSDRETLFGTTVEIHSLNELENLEPFIIESWRSANDKT